MGNFPLVLVKSVLLSQDLLSAAITDRRTLGWKLFLPLCFSAALVFLHQGKWNSIVHLQAGAFIKELNCRRAGSASFKGLSRLWYGL